MMLQVIDKDLKFIEENCKNKNDKYTIDFTKDQDETFRITSGGELKYSNNSLPILCGNTKLLSILRIEKKNASGEFKKVEKEALGLGTEENEAKELIISFLPSSIFGGPEAEKGKTAEIGNSGFVH